MRSRRRSWCWPIVPDRSGGETPWGAGSSAFHNGSPPRPGFAPRRRAGERHVAEETPEAYQPGESPEEPEALIEEIDRLPERLRTVVVLCYLEGLTYDAAAQRLGLTEDSIRGRLARARDRLRRRLTGAASPSPPRSWPPGASPRDTPGPRSRCRSPPLWSALRLAWRSASRPARPPRSWLKACFVPWS